MRPLSSTIMVFLVASLCGLCLVQWYRETDLRKLGVDLRNETTRLAGLNQDLDNRGKAADAEILRLTAALGELRTTSISKQQHDEQTAQLTHLREMAEKQNAAIVQQNEAITKQNTVIEQANESIKKGNESIKKLTEERDVVTKQLNETRAKYNKLVGEGGHAKPGATAATGQ